VAGCCECGDEPSGSCATELVRVNSISECLKKRWKTKTLKCAVCGPNAFPCFADVPSLP
jgi:hypothetical protein